MAACRFIVPDESPPRALREMRRTSGRRALLEVTFLLFIATGNAAAQVQYPRWTPIAVTPASHTTQKPDEIAGTASSPKAGWPYYSDSPLFANPTTGSTFVTTPYSVPVNVYPQQQYATQPVFNQPIMTQPVVTQPIVAQPTMPPAQVPMVQAAPQPTAPVYTPMPAQTQQPVIVANPQVPQTAPAQVQQPQFVQQPSPVQGPPVMSTSTQPDAPFIDNRVFLQGSKKWLVYDITSYTRRFQPGAAPENGIRQWIIRKTGDAAWMGGDVSTLVVTPEQLKVYQNPQVQEQIRHLLGRFLHYSPGQFRCRVQIVQAKEQDWRRDIVGRLQPISTQTGQGAWLVSRNGASEFLGEVIGEADGTVLANEEFLVANGQGALIRWASDQSKAANRGTNGPDTDPNFDGIELRFSPLIDQDAATIELDVNALVRRVLNHKEGMFGGRTSGTPEVTNVENKNLYQVPPQKLLMLSMGLVPRYDTHKGLFQKGKRGEILVFIDIAPEGVNSIQGVPLAVSPEVPNTRPMVQTTSKPTVQKSRRPHVPEIMTRSVTN